MTKKHNEENLIEENESTLEVDSDLDNNESDANQLTEEDYSSTDFDTIGDDESDDESQIEFDYDNSDNDESNDNEPDDESNDNSKSDLNYATTDTESVYHRTIQDDFGDYVFLNPKKGKKREPSADISNKTENISNYPLVASKNPSAKVKHSGHSGKRRKHRKKAEMKRWKKILLSVIATILALVILFVSTVALLISKGSKEMLITDYTILPPKNVDAQVQNQGKYIVYKGRTYQYNENIANILCMGIDKRQIEGTNANGTGGQADVIVLMAMDTITGKISLINISRDTMTDVTAYSANGSYIGSSIEQICLSYAYGDGKKLSCENTVTSVQRLFYNIPINSYIALDLDGIAVINDSIGGVDVTSPETIGQFKQGEFYHLEGDMAESFVRLRNQESVDSNTLRNMRQQVYVESFVTKLVDQTRKDFSTPVDLFNASSDYSCTNLNPSKIAYIAKTAVTSDGMSINMSNVPGQVKMGKVYAEYHVDEASFYELFLDVFYNPIN